ncbi:MAG TPA: hypothetical protein VF944_01060, partial [Candidatus Bathyarchaeia archaeon]
MIHAKEIEVVMNLAGEFPGAAALFGTRADCVPLLFEWLPKTWTRVGMMNGQHPGTDIAHERVSIDS